PFKDDYVADYYFGLMPAGYKATYFTVSQFIHPRIFSKILPYVLLFLTLLITTLSSYKLAGAFAGFATLALGLSGSEYILDLTAGGIPRSFKFLPLSIAIYALITKRPYWLAIVTIVSAGFYPPVAIISGATLALYLLFPLKLGGLEASWPINKRIFIIGITALLSIAILSPNLISLATYGTKINAYNPAQMKIFPERLDRQPLSLPARKVSLQAIGSRSFKSIKSALHASERNMYFDYFSKKSKARDAGIILLMLLTLAGAIKLWLSYDSARRLLIFLFSLYTCAFISLALYPLVYYPSRYLDSSLFLLMLVLVPASAGAVFSFIYAKAGWQSSRKMNFEILLSVVLVILLFGNKGPIRSGLLVTVPQEDAPVYDFIRSLPPQTVIAGWPKDGVIKNIPYLTNRRVLLSRETHLCFHEKYALEMRHRWELIVSSYFTPESTSTRKMVQEYGVTHMLIRKEYIDLQTKPVYFSAFASDIKQFMRKIELSGEAVVFENHKYIILALDQYLH
ncbi:MAG: hypothetical protein GQ529_10145, partial [Methyloprofundus sp.]|nr:hypothetical protein [Methyloprofundus sp.]